MKAIQRDAISTDDRGLLAVLQRDRLVVLGALGAVVAVSWLYLLGGAGMGMPAWQMTSGDMALGPSAAAPEDGMAGGMMAGMATPAGWSPAYAALIASMWWVMMVAMMLPSAAPMILLHARFTRYHRTRGAVLAPTGVFAAGYVLVWGGFSVAAAAAQWAFESTGLLQPMTMNTLSTTMAGVLLVTAGVYQLTPIKRACLRHCRSPVEFLSRHWRDGRLGALRMGAEHGAFCLGCCWVLMLLLFFGGVMNLYWIIGLAVFVLLEKVLPAAPWLERTVAAALVVWGTTFLWQVVA